MAQVLLARDYDPWSGFEEEFWFDAEENKVHIKRYQIVDNVLEINRRMRNDAPMDHSQDDGLFLKACIPFGVLEMWKEEGFDWFQSTDAEKRRRLNDPQWKNLLVRPGRM